MSQRSTTPRFGTIESTRQPVNASVVAAAACASSRGAGLRVVPSFKANVGVELKGVS
jgi:hypothetical protein